MEGTPISSSTHNLPAQLIPMVGREKEIGDLIGMLKNPDVRLITLHGFGGTGKTRLAVETGRAALELFPDGVWFVSLAPLSSPDHIFTAVAAAMGFSFHGTDDQTSQLIRFLQNKKILLICDNLEHLMPEGAAHIEKLLQKVTETQILVTSRQVINATWEWVYKLQGLDYEGDSSLASNQIPAVQLFLQHLNRGGVPVADHDPVCAAQVCQLVNGLPLALLLAASWGRVLACGEIIEEIKRGIGFLQARQKTFPERHSSMQAVFDYSWKLLSDQERAALRKLAIFRGGFDRNAAAEVAGAHLALLAALVDLFLIERDRKGRYQIHELLRKYLQERLVEAGEEQLTRDQHLEYYLQLAEQVESELRGKHQQAWLKRLQMDTDNIRAALDWSLAEGEVTKLEKGLRLMAYFERFWLSHTSLRECYTYLLQLLGKHLDALNPSAYAYTHARGLNLGAMLSFWLEDWSTTRHFAGEALRIGLELNEPQLLGDAYFYRGIEACERRESTTARVALEHALENYNKCGYLHGTTQALRGLGRNEFFERNFPAAFIHLSAALDLARKQEDARNIYSTMRILGELGTEYSQVGLDQARDYFAQALQYASEVNDKPFIIYLLNGMAEIARLEGEFEEAAKIFEQEASIASEIGNKESQIVTELNLALVYSRMRKYDRSKKLLMNNLIPSLLSEQQSFWLPMCLLGLTGIAAAEGNAQLGAKILGALDTYKEDLLFYKTDRNDYEYFLTSVKAQLSDKQFNQLYEDGKALSLEDAAQLIQSQGIKKKSRGDERLNQLTKREIEILRLVAQGLSDAQVAEHLVLSHRTVNAHLTSIYNKLGVNSRAAATRYAVEHGLA